MFKFTFFLAIPVMFGASLLKVLKFGVVFTSEELTILLVAMVVAVAVSIIVIKGLMQYIKKHHFTVFIRRANKRDYLNHKINVIIKATFKRKYIGKFNEKF